MLVVICGNSYLLSEAYVASPTFRDYGINTVARTTDGIVFSNNYAIGTYFSRNLLQAVFVSSMPAVDEFDNLISEMPNGTKMVLFNSDHLTFVSESSVGNYPLKMAGQQIILPSNAVNSTNLDSVKSPYFNLTEKISYNGDSIFVYELASQKLLNSNFNSDIVVNKLSWNIEKPESSNPDLVLTVNISSKREGTLTTVISNQLFSKVLSFQVDPGNNDVNLKFPAYVYVNNVSTPFGSQISQGSDILFLDDHCTLVFEGTTGIFQFNSISLVYYSLLVALIALILLLLSVYVGNCI
jgi:hypothetical protein